MKRADPAAAVSNSVNHDVAPGRHSLRGGAIDISLLRIRDVQGQMIIAVGFMEIDPIESFGRALIAFLFLRPDGRAAQGDAIRFENAVAAKKREPARGFLHADTIGHRVRGEGMQVEMRADHRGDGEEAKQNEEEGNHFYDLNVDWGGE